MKFPPFAESSSMVWHDIIATSHLDAQSHIKDGQQRLLLLFLQNTGLSVEKACELSIDHVMCSNQARQEIYVPAQEGGGYCGWTVVLNRDAHSCLSALLRTREDLHPAAPLLASARGGYMTAEEVLVLRESLSKVTPALGAYNQRSAEIFARS